MENKINIAELLKDCPKGMELDCVLFEDVRFEECAGNCIYIRFSNGGLFALTEYGNCLEFPISKCVIFPKGKTTWEGFVPPCEFKDGDIIYNQGIKATAIFNKQTDDVTISHCFLNRLGEFMICHYHCKNLSGWRLATECEKRKLFDVIKDNGYIWNAETKTLEQLVEPKFKVGDRIKRKGDTRLITIKEVRDDCCIITFKDVFDNAYITDKLLFSNQDEYEIISNKFDINTLKPFDKVLVRGSVGQKWTHDFFGFMDKDRGYPFVCVGHYVIQYIPYEGNEHLLGKTDDCDDFYKTWE